MKEAECPVRVLLGKRPEPPMKKQWLENEQYQGEEEPNEGHEMNPPERRVLVPTPGVEPVEHVKARQAGDERDRTSLHRELPLNGFEEPQAFLTARKPAECWDNHCRHERDSTDPQHDTQHMENPGKGQRSGSGHGLHPHEFSQSTIQGTWP